MSGETEQFVSGWTTDTLHSHLVEMLRAGEKLRTAQEKFEQERDRRYSEVALEREKALKIKEEADKAALALAREIQTYKDEKANELREQIGSERGLYARKDDVGALADKIDGLLKPINEYISSARGTSIGKSTVSAPLWGIGGFVVGGIILAAVLSLGRLAINSPAPLPPPAARRAVR